MCDLRWQAGERQMTIAIIGKAGVENAVGQAPPEVGASLGQIPTHQPKTEGGKQNEFHK